MDLAYTENSYWPPIPPENNVPGLISPIVVHPVGVGTLVSSAKGSSHTWNVVRAPSLALGADASDTAFAVAAAAHNALKADVEVIP